MDAAAPSLQTYFDKARSGDHVAALEAARAVCQEAPKSPTSHYALGEAHAALGEHADAAAGFAAALRLAPGWADAWVNLGLARYRMGAIWHAKIAMREALKHAPDHAAAAANLGALMRISGETEAGEHLLHEKLRQAPEKSAVRLNIVAELLQAERGGEALALLDEAPSPPQGLDDLSAWRLARSLALLQCKRIAEARAEIALFEAIRPVPAQLAPLWIWRRLLVADAEGDRTGARNLAGEMEAAIEAMGPNALPEHKLMAHYDLARFWSWNDALPLAFAHWSAGHALLRVSQPYSRAYAGAFLEAQVATFDAARFARARASNSDPLPVFIVGMARSGTTLCEQILAAHGRVHGAGERTALPDAFVRLGGGEGVSALGGVELDAEAASYLDELRALAPDKARIIDKMPGNELYLGLVGLVLPGAKIIHCVRDPRDIGLSIWTHRFFGVHAYAHDLGDLGWTIAERAKLVAHWRKVLPNPILVVALSDWVHDFDGTLARVLTHLDIPPDPACARFYESDREVRTASRAQVKTPVNSRGLGRWQAYAAELAPLIEELRAGGMLAD